MEQILKRKIDAYLESWKITQHDKPLIVKGARQIGKTRSIEHFAAQHYKHVIKINFVEQIKYRDIFNDGFEVDTILKNISLLNPILSSSPTTRSFSSMNSKPVPICATALKILSTRWTFRCHLFWLPYGNQLPRNRIQQRRLQRRLRNALYGF